MLYQAYVELFQLANNCINLIRSNAGVAGLHLILVQLCFLHFIHPIPSRIMNKGIYLVSPL